MKIMQHKFQYGDNTYIQSGFDLNIFLLGITKQINKDLKIPILSWLCDYIYSLKWIYKLNALI
jgi:hypothetical protein